MPITQSAKPPQRRYRGAELFQNLAVSRSAWALRYRLAAATISGSSSASTSPKWSWSCAWPCACIVSCNASEAVVSSVARASSHTRFLGSK